MSRILVSTGKTSLASLLMGVVCWGVYPWLCRLASLPGVRYQLLQVGGTLAAGAVVFLACSIVLRSDEARRALALATRFRKDGAASR
jgi:peptidoglycan biosynthesis protein MviN/MurJ (putative lipid II flippase)